MASKRKIYILLTRFPDTGSKIIHALTGFRYTHASIGLEEDANTFYSFVEKGFIVEKIDRYVKPDRKPFECRVYELEVSARVYERIKDIVTTFVIHKPDLSYSRLGVVMGLCRVPVKRKHKFFCSQFVAEVLERSRAVILDKDSALYFPGDLTHLPGLKLNFQGNMKGLLYRNHLVGMKM